MFKSKPFRYCIKCKTPNITLGLMTLAEFRTRAVEQYDELSMKYSIEALNTFLSEMLEGEGIPQETNTYIIPMPCFITGQIDYNAAVIMGEYIFIFSNNQKYLRSINGYGKINELLLI